MQKETAGEAARRNQERAGRWEIAAIKNIRNLFLLLPLDSPPHLFHAPNPSDL
jgi:hypothetical protein